MKIIDKLPEAYRKGVADFYGRDFKVNSGVLIPRPETEMAIDEVLLLMGRPYLSGMKAPKRELPKRPVIVDVGTGSGCIAITLKLELPETEVVGLDISNRALNVARENASTLGADVDFMCSDLLESYAGPAPDVIVANLPYVNEKWEWLDKEALGYEPSLALYADNRGLKLIFELTHEVASEEKYHQTWLLLEADPCQHEEIIKYAVELGLQHQKTSGFWLVFRKDD